jgi:dUTP pyrophosphatase
VTGFARVTAERLPAMIHSMANDPRVVFEPLASGVQPPRRATSESAGYDLSAYLLGGPVRVAFAGAESLRDVESGALTLEPGERALIPLGFRARIAEGYHGEVRPRSGAAFRKGIEIPNSPGTIDSDYNGEWMVPVKNGDSRPIIIEHGERIAQVVFVPHVGVEFTTGSVTRTTERDGGFGSTGAR